MASFKHKNFNYEYENFIFLIEIPILKWCYLWIAISPWIFVLKSLFIRVPIIYIYIHHSATMIPMDNVIMRLPCTKLCRQKLQNKHIRVFPPLYFVTTQYWVPIVSPSQPRHLNKCYGTHPDIRPCLNIKNIFASIRILILKIGCWYRFHFKR